MKYAVTHSAPWSVLFDSSYTLVDTADDLPVLGPEDTVVDLGTPAKPLYIHKLGSNLRSFLIGTEPVEITFMNDAVLGSPGRAVLDPVALADAVFPRYPWATQGYVETSRTAECAFVDAIVSDKHLMDLAFPRPKASVLITGAYGFIGSHFANRMSAEFPGVHFFLLDSFSYAAKLSNVVARRNVTAIRLDLSRDDLGILRRLPNLTHVFHFAAQTHVDNSYSDASCFTSANVDGTQRLLDAVRKVKSDTFVAFVHVSTDEVFGETHEAPSTVLSPTNPYAASKAAAEMYVLAYSSSYGIPVVITRCNNVFGPKQFPEKLVPKTIKRFFEGKPMTIHGDGTQRRTYLYVDDVADAFVRIYNYGTAGVAPRHTYYHIGAGPSHERTTREIVSEIAKAFTDLRLTLPVPMTVGVSDRPFNDARYLLDSTSIVDLGWAPKVSIRDGLVRCVVSAMIPCSVKTVRFLGPGR